MSPQFDAIGIVSSDMTASVAFYRLLGLTFPAGAEGEGHVEAELPGMELSDLEILVHGNQLSIKGERPEPSGEEKKWHRQERGYGKFTRLIELPFDLDQAKVEAELRNGVLSITLPKREESKPRRIEVKAN